MKPGYSQLFPKSALWDISIDVQSHNRFIQENNTALKQEYDRLNKELNATGGKITSEVRVIQGIIESLHGKNASRNSEIQVLEKKALDLLRSKKDWEVVSNTIF